MTRVRILRVRGARCRRPGVLAFVGEHRVTWHPAGWHCSCEDPACLHVDAVADLLDPRLTDPTITERTTA